MKRANQYLNNKIQSIYDLLAKGQLEIAIEETKELVKSSSNKNELNQIIILSSRYYRIKDSLIKGVTHDISEVENQITTGLIDILAQLEGDIINQLSPLNLNYSESDEGINLMSLIAEFKNQTSLVYAPTAGELEKIFEIKVNLYELIFKNFDNKLKHIPNLREKEAKVIFNRILANSELSTIDIFTISQINKSSDYRWHEKVIIISALMLSLINKFDEAKVHILIDFLTQFEEKVWIHALVALIFSIDQYDKKILIYNNIVNRLEKLKPVDEVQGAIQIVDLFIKSGFYKLSILSVGNFDSENLFTNLEDNFIPIIKNMDEELFDKIIDGVLPSFINKKEIKNSYSRHKANQNVKSGSNFPNIIKKAPYFSNIYNWFTPFYENNPLGRSFIFKYNFDNDPRVFQSLIYDSILLSDIEKYSLIINLENYNKQQFEQILFLLVNERYIADNLLNILAKKLPKLDDSISTSSNPLTNEDRSLIIKFIRNIHEFFQSYPQNQFINIFTPQLNIYNSLVSQLVIKQNSDSDGENNNPVKIEAVSTKDPNSAEFNIQDFLEKLTQANIDQKINFNDHASKRQFEVILALLLKDETSVISDYLIDDNVLGIRNSIFKTLIEKKEYEKVDELLTIHSDKLYSDSSLLYDIAFSYYEAHRLDKSLEYFRIIEKSGKISSSLLANIGYCHLANGEFDIAENYFNKSLEINPREGLALKNLGLLKLIKNDISNAKVHFELSIKDDALDIQELLLNDYSYFEKHIMMNFENYKDLIIGIGKST